MGKKMSFTSLFKQDISHVWPWPSCNNLQTDSFRACNEVYKTVSSIYIDHVDEFLTTSESWFTNSSECESSSTLSEESDEESLEYVIHGLSSGRFFVEPNETKSIMEVVKGNELPFEESVALAMDSKDPYVDFRVSMEEMVEAHGLKDWECLDEMLQWYLRANGKKAHAYIVEAFVDLLVALVSASIECNEKDCSALKM